MLAARYNYGMNVHSHRTLHMPTVGFADPAKNIAALGVEEGMKAADFGAGSGAYTLELARAVGESGRVYAIEVQRDLLRRIRNDSHARGFDSHIEFIWGDVEERNGSKIADGLLDFVLVSNLLFQLPDKRAALLEARRVLKSTGRLALVDWSDSYGGMGPQKADVIKKDEAFDIARKAGFDLVGEFAAGAHHYGLLLRPAVVPA